MQLDVKPFRADCTDKDAAKKVVEEAAEAFAEWVIMTDTPLGESGDHRLPDELADCITACANLAERYGLDMQAALDRVERRNRERGRYDD
jgi:NTP pyrophosphatase (non-canonical NTP hydrolase)